MGRYCKLWWNWNSHSCLARVLTNQPNLILFCFIENGPTGFGPIHGGWDQAKSIWRAWQTNSGVHEVHRSLQGKGNRHKTKKVFFFKFLFLYLTVIVKWFLCFPKTQDEQYNHLDELEVTQVEKQVNDAMAWMNNKMNQQNSQDLTLDPVVKVQEIQAKAKVQRSTRFQKKNQK